MAQNYDNIPQNFRPISAWGYVGYQILFSIPLIGFILLIVFSFDSSNINRRNFARSYFCILLLSIIFVGVFIGLFVALGLSISEFDIEGLVDGFSF